MPRQRRLAYVDDQMFYDERSHVGIPYLAGVRSDEALSGQLARNRMNSPLPHGSERSLRLLSENRSLTMTCLAHTTNIFQVLRHVEETESHCPWPVR
jgi:hypothetical protein